MENETKMDSTTCCGNHCKKKGWEKCGGGSSGAVYGLGFIGAAIYYIQGATTFWAGVIGLLKALVWPAFLVYHALAYFGI
jgi:hypothetical protein